MSVRTVIPDVVGEKSTWYWQGTLQDEKKQAIPGSNIDSLTLVIYCLNGAQTIIQAATNILNVTGERGTVDNAGLATITFRPADSAILDDTLDEERHLALLLWQWPRGATGNDLKAAYHEIEWPVSNLAKVT